MNDFYIYIQNCEKKKTKAKLVHIHTHTHTGHIKRELEPTEMRGNIGNTSTCDVFDLDLNIRNIENMWWDTSHFESIHNCSKPPQHSRFSVFVISALLFFSFSHTQWKRLKKTPEREWPTKKKHRKIYECGAISRKHLLLGWVFTVSCI